MQSFIFVLIGTGGDVWPGIGVARELRRRGHDVVVLAYDYFAEDIAKAGLAFHSVGSRADYVAQVSQADFWSSTRGPLLAIGEGGYVRLALQPAYDYVAGRRAGQPVVVCTRNAYGARFAAEQHRLPCLTLAYSPQHLIAPDHLPYPNNNRLVRALPYWYKQFVLNLNDRAGAGQLLPVLNPLRQQWGLTPLRYLLRWICFGGPSVALFPAWFDDVGGLAARGVRQGDFIFSHTDEQAPLPPAVAAFLDAGEPPVVLTFGTGVAHVRPLFQSALAALQGLGRRAIFVTKFRENIPAHPGGAVLVVDYADFAALLPRAALLVHHGGIGTAAQALRAGIPQLILPLAYDQPDNGARIQAMGCGDFLPGGPPTAARLQQKIAAVAAIDRAPLKRWRAVLLKADGARRVADVCEGLAGPARVPAARRTARDYGATPS